MGTAGISLQGFLLTSALPGEKSKQMLIGSGVGVPTCCFRRQQSTVVDTGHELISAGAQL